jgi:dynein heavy chain, axonemal
MQKLVVDKADAEEVQKVVSKEETEANIQKREAESLAAEAEAAVSEAKQMLDQTLAEVNKLKKDHLTEVKALPAPPKAVKVVLGGVVILLLDFIKKQGGSIVVSTVDGVKEENYF